MPTWTVADAFTGTGVVRLIAPRFSLLRIVSSERAPFPVAVTQTWMLVVCCEAEWYVVLHT
jgi:hypothetical protein